MSGPAELLQIRSYGIDANRKVFITGGTRGLGLCLARGFLEAGSSVFINGRSEASVRTARQRLEAEGLPGARLGGGAGDAGKIADLERLAAEAGSFFGAEPDLVVNAGISQKRGRLWELEPGEVAKVFDLDLGGAFAATRVFMPGLFELAKSGCRAAIWFVEGHGSNGRIMEGLSTYGTAKRALAYFWRALAVETRSTGVVVAALSPGIMATDFILDPSQRGGAEDWARTKRIFNILADRPETVAGFAVPRILACRKTGSLVAWLTPRKVFFRFATSAFRRRKIID